MTRRIIMSDVNFSAPKCKEWVRRDNAVIAPCQRLPFYDLVVDQAKGDILVDVDNNTFIDFLSSAFLKPLSPIKLMLFISVTSIIPTINIYLVTELKRFLYFLMKLYYSKLCLSMVFAIFYL